MTEREALRLLHLDEGCSRDQLRRAYLDMVKVWHPDRFQTDAKLRAKAERTLQRINDAYALLQAGPSSGTATREQRRGDTGTVRHARAEASPPPPTRSGLTRHLAFAAAAGTALGILLAGVAIVRWNRAPEPAVSATVTPAEDPSTAPADVDPPAKPRRPVPRSRSDAVRPESGHDLLSARGRGAGQVSALNATTWDAAVVLEGPAGTRGFFLRHGERVTLLDVAPGTYTLRVMFGATWTGRMFTQGAGFFQLPEPVQIVSPVDSAGARAPLLLLDRTDMQPAATFGLE